MSKRKKKEGAHEPTDSCNFETAKGAKDVVNGCHNIAGTQYFRRPEVLEKDRMRVASRREATKARRRRRDQKPCTFSGEAQNTQYCGSGEDEPGESVHSGKHEELAEENTLEPSLTPAENFALAVLTEMATTRGIDANTAENINALTATYGPATVAPPVVPVGLSYANSDGIDSVLERANQLSSDGSPSNHSSALAVNEETISIPRGRPSRYVKRLPPFVAPATTLQKKVQRELGVIGPLTDIQQAQIAAFELGEIFCWDEVDSPAPSVASFLSSARWEMICDWRWHPEYDTEWDVAARRGFAEAALIRRFTRNAKIV
ncbi:hypothetical protein C8R47DRAFT_1083817 [Mycena vitilis]|nr:hypothetical protein C8R47DRAFT_1083817 [Mycena vitilis]